MFIKERKKKKKKKKSHEQPAKYKKVIMRVY